MPIVELDLETKSRIDIKEAGAGRYASDPSTRILCTCWAVDNGPVQGLMGDQAPEILFDYVKKGYTFSAFNAIFEIMIWKYRWPDLPLPKFICTRSLVAAHGLPQTLDRACKALNIGMAKDIEGKRLINTYSTPRLNGEFNELKGPDAKAMLQYCAKDVILSRRIRQRLPALTAEEQKVYDWTVDANLRGIVIDTQLATEAEGIASSLQAVGNKELAQLTGGKIFSVSQIQRIRNYLTEEYGITTESLDKEAIEELLLQDNIPTNARRILELRRDLSQTSVKKFQRAKLSVCDDGRVRDTLIYHGAATGRWCMPGEAEVLTPQGWVRLDMWKGGDLLRWAPHVEGHSTPGYFHWEKDAVVHGFPYAGPMIQIDHRNIKGLFTPDHRFPVYNKRQDFHIRTAEKLASGDYIPVSGNSLGVRSTASDIHTRFWVMLQADGHIIAGGSVRFHFKKLRKIERCVALLTEAGIKYTRRQYSCGCVIRVLKRDLPEGWGVKHFSNALLTHNPKVFLDEIPYWDGSRDLENSKQGFEYTSTCLSDAEWVVTMAHLTGFAASINARRRVSDRWKPAYRVYVRNLDRVQIRKSHLKKVLYAGHVYCPKTHSGYFLCRYQGTVFVSGNTSQVVQFQNLPKYAVPDMDTALALIKTKDAELFDFAYAQPMLTLSGCIRGLVLPSPGKKLAVVDYNAIEARILMWAAGQEDAVDDFHKGRDIYVEMAREIYRNKNLTKENKKERSLGKQAVLGCIAEGSLVYSDTGYKPIEQINRGQRLWDGEQWVNFRELVGVGPKSVIQVGGLWLTPDHLLLTRDGWRTAGEIDLDGGTLLPRLINNLDISSLSVANLNGVLNVWSLCAVYAGLKKIRELTNFGAQEIRCVIDALRVSKDSEAETPENTLISFLIHVYANGGLFVGGILNDAVQTQIVPTIRGMVLVAFPSPSNPVESSWNTLLHWIGGTGGDIPSIELIMPEGTEEEIFELLHRALTTSIGETIKNCYDLLGSDSGRFVAGNLIVHNCGYGMGHIKFQATCEGYGIDLGEKTEYVEREDKKTKETIRIRYSPLAKRAVETYRTRFSAVPQFWYGMQSAAENCVRTGRPTAYGRYRFSREREFLYLQLPSGRCLAYHRPGLDKDGLYYYAEDRTTFQYTKRRTYGGRLVENAIQATARDILAHGILKLEENGFPVILTVHDENVVEIEEGYEPALAAIIYNMCDLPKWAQGCPITAEGFITERYRKG